MNLVPNPYFLELEDYFNKVQLNEKLKKYINDFLCPRENIQNIKNKLTFTSPIDSIPLHIFDCMCNDLNVFLQNNQNLHTFISLFQQKLNSINNSSQYYLQLFLNFFYFIDLMQKLLIDNQTIIKFVNEAKDKLETFITYNDVEVTYIPIADELFAFFDNQYNYWELPFSKIGLICNLFELRKFLNNNTPFVEFSMNPIFTKYLLQ